MTPQEFGPEIARLFEGWKKADDLTPARLTAYFERYGSLSVEVWRAVVTRALMLPNGMPYDNQLDKLVNEVEAEQQQRNAHSVRGRGQGGGYVDALEKNTATIRSHHGRFWMTIIRGQHAENLTPAEVATVLEAQDWPSDCAKYIDVLKSCEDWDTFHQVNRSAREPAYQPKPITPEQEAIRWDMNH